MPGQGSQSKLGLRIQSVQGTGVEPTTALPVKSAAFTAPKTLIFSETIGGDGMKDNAVAGDAESSGSVVQEFDAESSGNLLWLANGDNGYTSAAATTVGQITTAPAGTPGGTGATIPVGDYFYSVAAIWTHDFLGKHWVMPDSAASTAVTVTSGQEVALTWTDPTGLTFPDHTYKGTAIYRSTVDAAATTNTLLHYVAGTGASYTDTGTNAYADTAVAPVTNTAVYKHILVGAAAATGLDRLKYFTAQFSKNVTDDTRIIDNKASDVTITVGDRASVVEISMNAIGGEESIISGEYSASSPGIKKQILGRDARIVIDGVTDCDVQSFSITLNNNLERLPTLCGVTIGEGDREVSGDMTRIFDDLTLANKAINGDEVSIELHMAGQALVTSGATLSESSHGVTAIPFPRLAKFDIERAAVAEFSAPLEGSGQIIATASFGALKGTVSTTDMTITLYNTLAEYTGA